MIDLRNVMSPIETANGLPNACYVDDAMFTHERDTLFRDSWAAIGFGKDIPRPGMVKPSISLALRCSWFVTPKARSTCSRMCADTAA